jgi:hypothetical protein
MHARGSLTRKWIDMQQRHTWRGRLVLHIPLPLIPSEIVSSMDVHLEQQHCRGRVRSWGQEETDGDKTQIDRPDGDALG